MDSDRSAEAGASATRRRRLQPDARRLEIVDAAVAHFAEVGLSGSTRDVARRAGVTQALLYKYFASKADLVEAVFERVYLGRLSPGWQDLIRDRRLSLRERLNRFYGEYTRAIFTYEWMRIFMFSGLAGERLNRRYLEHVRDVLLVPLLQELSEPGHGSPPDEEDIWNLHGGIVYIGIRRFIYQLPTPDDLAPVIERAIDRFLGAYADAYAGATIRRSGLRPS
ncbi:TetR/AcrR family transcriptional regulator [Phreatobacter sp.]|uniref:TetR/AcrR family transcriptional regulator n=1 Tax=Phreatobacter sp. TaxID=1966341 RepID=UPI003F6F62F3